MEDQLSRDDTYLHNIWQINALIDYVRRAGFETLNEYQKDKFPGLTHRQGMVIATVLRMTRQHREGVTLSCLARELHMGVSAASHLIDSLVKLNLLKRNTHEDDRRSVCITLSPAGQQCAAAARKGLLKAINTLTARLTPEENELRLRIIDLCYRAAYPDAT